MNWETWAEEVQQKTQGMKILTKAESWLYREAYYDNYDMDAAIALANDRKTSFHIIRNTGGWLVIK